MIQFAKEKIALTNLFLSHEKVFFFFCIILRCVRSHSARKIIITTAILAIFHVVPFQRISDNMTMYSQWEIRIDFSLWARGKPWSEIICRQVFSCVSVVVLAWLYISGSQRNWLSWLLHSTWRWANAGLLETWKARTIFSVQLICVCVSVASV